MKEEFIRQYRSHIKRTGASDLLTWLLSKSDFMVAPASTKYHLSCEGGLVEHSLNVYYRLKKLASMETIPWDGETLAIVALLHDLCKVNFYKQAKKNVKKNGRWEEEPYYTIDDQLPYGHGEKSVYIIRGFMNLTREEALAIRFHMGYTEEGGYAYKLNVGKVFQRYPLALLLHTADVLASNIDEAAMLPEEAAI